MGALRTPGVILQHGEDGPAALFGAWCERRGIGFTVRRVWEDGPPPNPADFGWICALGADETPNRAGNPAWVDAEVDFLRSALGSDVPVLGLCFGGQALACAAGGSVGPSAPAEVGWLAIETADPTLVPPGPWLHFHYDQLEPPPGAVELARSPAGPAAFRCGRNLGLQFHPEATPAIAGEWARTEAAELAALGVGPGDVAEQGRRCGAAAEDAATRLFDGWWTTLVEP
jgi:GMP synthase-like glutamine amidotransferase